MRRDDRTLVEAIRAGQTELYAELVDRHQNSVFRLVRAAIAHTADADDIAQDAFLASFRALPRLRDPRRFRAHLLAITARKVADHLRRKKVRAGIEPLEEDPPAPPPPDRRESLLAAVERVVQGLPSDARLVFALRHHEGLSCVQIARLLDLPEGTVYSRISRAHAAIRQAVEVE